MGEATELWFFGIFCAILVWLWFAGPDVEEHRMLPLNDEEAPHGGR
ncbi:MAG: hypothetical protein ACYCW6_01175 [Candidatus Xenobia bacterium]